MQTLFTRLISVGAFSLFASQALAAPINATLHKDPNCGCCVEYANYLEDNGFNVKMIDHANMTPVKQRLGTAQAASCHTVEIEGYVVEGHVLALPGMPMNSPGMGPEKKGSLQVLELDAQGKPTGVYITL